MHHDVPGASEWSVKALMLRRMSSILYRNPVIVFGSLIYFDIMPIIYETSLQNMYHTHRQTQNTDSKEDFETTYEAGDKNENGNVGVEEAVENVVVPPAVSQPMDVPPFMHNLDLNAMHAPEFLEYTNIGVTDSKDGECRIGMEYSSRKSVVVAIKSYIISRGVDYNMYESDP
ncbi:hypothetical protein AHAS_Ahas11G0229300 [Arachis hypogaea]